MNEAFGPVPDEASAPFFDGARRGKLMLQCCAACGTWLYPVKHRCPDCSATLVAGAKRCPQCHAELTPLGLQTTGESDE